MSLSIFPKCCQGACIHGLGFMWMEALCSKQVPLYRGWGLSHGPITSGIRETNSGSFDVVVKIDLGLAWEKEKSLNLAHCTPCLYVREPRMVPSKTINTMNYITLWILLVIHANNLKKRRKQWNIFITRRTYQYLPLPSWWLFLKWPRQH